MNTLKTVFMRKRLTTVFHKNILSKENRHQGGPLTNETLIY